MITFDTSGGPAELIVQLDPTTLSYTAQEIYSAWKDWVLLGNANWAPAFRVVGGDDLGGGVKAPAFYFLQNVNNWRIRMPEADIETEINGNIVAEDREADLTVSPAGEFSPTLSINLSNVATSSAAALGGSICVENLSFSVPATELEMSIESNVSMNIPDSEISITNLTHGVLATVNEQISIGVGCG